MSTISSGLKEKKSEKIEENRENFEKLVFAKQEEELNNSKQPGKAGPKLSAGLFKQYRRENEKDNAEQAPYDIEKFYKVFMARCDPEGYLCALECLTEVPENERWEEWQRLLGNSWFAGQVNRWKRELDVALRSSAISKIAQGADPKNFNALKWLAEGKAFGHSVRGRKTKEEREYDEGIQRDVRNKNPNADQILKQLNEKRGQQG